jgi:hypothetical protein
MGVSTRKSLKAGRRLPGVVGVCVVGFLLVWATDGPPWLLALAGAVFVSLCWITSKQDAARTTKL